jgi:hypothetical protein
MNHYLKFASEAEAIKAMPQYCMKNADMGDSQWITSSHNHALDPIGTLYAPTGAKTEDGDDVMAALPGWHCNLMCEELPEELAQFEVFPQSPKRVWA